MSSDIFCKIVRGEQPATIVFETEEFLAFLDKQPQSAGHTLLVPKHHVAYFTDMEQSDFLSLMRSAHTLSQAVKRASGSKRVSLRLIGKDVPHVHVHIVPDVFEGVGGKKEFEEIAMRIREETSLA